MQYSNVKCEPNQLACEDTKYERVHVLLQMINAIEQVANFVTVNTRETKH